MNVVAFVPIKMNNERLPGKNTKEFSNGRPLITYILDTLTKVKGINDIYVYCSDEAICRYLPENVKFLKREKRLDLSTTSFNEVLSSFANLVPADAYLLTHATAPFLSEKSMEKAIAAVSSGRYDSAFSACRLQEFIWRNGKPFNYDLKAIPRTQDLEELYYETCGMYLYRDYLIKEQNRRIGDTPFLVEVSKIEAIDINQEDDFLLADAIARMLEKE